MRLVFGSISMVTVLAGMTLPQTTIFNVRLSHGIATRRLLINKGAQMIQAPLVNA
jgi:hypothetical protein